MLTQALAYGIDGWKCDGTDPYILELVIPRGKKGIVTRREYSNAYYGDFFNYTRNKMGNKTLIMSRPADGLVIYQLGNAQQEGKCKNVYKVIEVWNLSESKPGTDKL